MKSSKDAKKRFGVVSQNLGALSLVLLAAAPQVMAQEAAPAPASSGSSADEEVITLSPFTVDSSTEKGFFAQNTLAGSRMNTNVADLASAISVVTKQQLEDTGSLDINDVFRYEIGTEGSSTYTPTTPTMRGDGVADAIGGASSGSSTTPSTNATANRVRGLGSPTAALNYYTAISAVPFDSYNTQSVEISRGPNSMLFGMGSPAGIVNQSTAKASLNKDTGSFSIRTDDRGSKRTSFSFNKVLVPGKLAIYGAALYNDTEFERKPSYDITRRQYAAITFKPFKSTTISANIERYDNDNRRPNSLTPIDTVTQWRAAGMPTYNNLTKRVEYPTTGQTTPIPYLLSANAPGAGDVIDYLKSLPGYTPSMLKDSKNSSGIRTVTYGGLNIFSTAAMTNQYLTGDYAKVANPLFVAGIAPQSSGTRSVQRISGGELQDWYQPPASVNYASTWGANSAGTQNVLNTGTATASNFVYNNATWADVYQRQITTSANYSAPASFVMSTYRYPGVSDKSIYDWENINVSQANFGNSKNTTYNVELEQEILPGLLNFSAGWFRQDYESLSSYTIAQLNANTLFVDTNKYSIDGTANPYFGKVYVEDYDPDRYRNIETVDQYRAMLAFTPDFTKRDGWTRWFGRHQILGLASYMDDKTTAFRERLAFTGGSDEGKLRYLKNPLNDASGNPTGWAYISGSNNGGSSLRRQYYLSSPGDANGTVTHSSGAWDNEGGSGQVYAYDYGTNSFKTVDVQTGWVIHNANTQKNQRQLTSYSGGWTSYFWNDRLIGTLGIRRDINRTHQTTAGATSTEAALTNPDMWVDGNYQYERVFNRWTDWSRTMGTTKTVGGVFKPFQHWGPISRRAASGNVFWEVVENFGFSANKSDNFDAPTGTYVDFFGKKLPKPEGTGKDYGFQFSAFKNKLFVRVNWFDSTNENSIMGGTSDAAMSRLSGSLDTTAYRSWLENIYVINQGYDPEADSWRQSFDNDPAAVAAMQKTVGQWWGLGNWDYYSNLGGTVKGTGTTQAKGTEIEINYNPLPNWTIRFTGSKTKTTNSNLLREFDAWQAVRMEAWKNAKATDFLAPQYAHYADGYRRSGATDPTNIKNFWTSTNYNSTIKSDSASGYYTTEAYYNLLVTPQYKLAKDLDGQQVMNQRKYNWSLLTTYTFNEGRFKGFSIGGAERWGDKAVIGYYGKASGADSANPNRIDMSDVTRPIYDEAMWYTDLWVGYTTKIMKDKVRMKIQLNVNDVFQDGELKPISVNYDGSVSAYRIVDPRTFVLSATFSF